MTYLVNRGIVGEKSLYPKEIEIVAEVSDTKFSAIVDWDYKSSENLIWFLGSAGNISWWDVSDVEDPTEHADSSYGSGLSTPLSHIFRHTDGTNNDHVIILHGDRVSAVNMSTLSSPYVDETLATDNWVNDATKPIYSDTGGRYVGTAANDSDRFTLIDVSDCTAVPGLAYDYSIYSASSLNAPLMSRALLGDTFIQVLTADGLTGVDINTPSSMSIMEEYHTSGVDGGFLARMTYDQLYNLYAWGSNNKITAVDWQDTTSGDPYEFLGDLEMPADTKFDYAGNDLLFAYSITELSFYTIDVSDPTDMFIADRIRDARVADCTQIIAGIDNNYVYVNQGTEDNMLVVKLTP